MHNMHHRRRHRTSENVSSSHYGGNDVDPSLPLLVSRADATHSQPRPQSSHHYPHSPPRQDYSMPVERSSRERQRAERWRQDESSPYPSNHDRYSHSSSVDPYDPYHRDHYYDHGDERYTASSSARSWIEGSEREYASASHAERSWTSEARYEVNSAEYDRWESRDRDVSREDYRDSDRRRDSFTHGETSRIRDHGWQSRDQEWDREPAQRRHEWNRDSRSPWLSRASIAHAPSEDRTWKPAASWQSGERGSQLGATGGAHSKRNKKKQTQAPGRRGWQNNHNSKKPYDWRDGPSNWPDAPDPRENRSKRQIYDRPTAYGPRTGSKRPPASLSRSHSRSPMSRSPSITHSRSSKRPRREHSSHKDDRMSSRSRSRSVTASPHSHRYMKSEHRYVKRSKSPYSAASRRSDDDRGRRRQRSTSSSSRSSHSLSQQRRSLHRLPVSYTTKTKNLPLLDVRSSPRPLNPSRSISPVGIKNHRNGKARPNANGHQLEFRYNTHRDRGREWDELSRQDLDRRPLPPPASPILRNGQRVSSHMIPSPPSPQPTGDTSMVHNVPSSGAADSMHALPISALQPDPRSRGPVSRGRHGGRLLGTADAAVKKFFPGDDDDGDVDVPLGHTVPPPPGKPRWITLSGAPSSKSLQRSSVQKLDTPRSQSPPKHPSPPRELGAHEDLMETSTSHPKTTCSPQDLQSLTQPSEFHPEERPNERQNEHQSEHPDSVVRVTVRNLPPPDRAKEELYKIVSQVGEGTFGKVYKAQNTVTSLFVALKRIRMEGERDGFPVTAMREIKVLQSLHHPNVVNLHEMMVSKGHAYMVFEYMDHDLTGVLSQTQFSFTPANLKSLCRQMLAGLAYLHHKGVIHRDIKGSNILINNHGELKLADFGLARFYQKRRRSDYTNRVITLWYRPPELLLGTTVYGPEVDMWSAGCIMLELFTTKPIFQGNDEIHQLQVVYDIMGSPNPNDWPGLTELPWYELVKPKRSTKGGLRELFRKWLSPAGLDLAEGLLAYDPTKRVTAAQALEAPYFLAEEPPEVMPELSSLEGEWHEFESKRERERKKRRRPDP